MTHTPKHLYLVDGSGYIFRAFFGMPSMSRPDGTPTNAVYGFTNMIIKLLGSTDADYVGIVFDRARKTFRSDIYPDYKAHRDAPPEDLIPQFPLVREATQAFDFTPLDMDGFEADDLIATYARQAANQGAKVTIVSSDKDLMQLVDENISMLDPMKNKIITPDGVVEKFGVTPDKVIDVQALAGDSADNVPGVPGIGPKTAAELINEYGSLENLLDNAENIKQPKRRERLIENADLARISKQLVTLKSDVNLDVPLSGLKRPSFNMEKVVTFLQEQNFKSLINKFTSDGGMGEHNTTTTSTPTVSKTTDVIKNYELVTTIEELKKWIAKAKSIGTVAVDTETTSLNTLDAQLVGVCLAVAPGDACYIPLRHKNIQEEQASLPDNETGDLFATPPSSATSVIQIAPSDAIPLLKDLLEDTTVLKVAHNLKYDMAILEKEGINITPYDDTMLLSFVNEGGLHRHSLDELAKLIFDYKTIKFEDICGKGKKQITFDKVNPDDALEYAAEDADITIRLHNHFKPLLVQNKVTSVYETLERPLIPVLCHMEKMGVRVNPIALRETSDAFGNTITQLETEIHKHADSEFNIASPKQLGDILFDKLGLEGGKKTKTGSYSTNSSVLEKLVDEHPIINPILQHRTLSKLKSTYSDALLEQIHPKTNRIHTSFMMTGAQTGRLSSTDPNLQNIPIKSQEGRMIRDAFIPDEGYTLLCCDYSQIELRLMAEMANIDALKTAFNNGIDIHAMTASQVFGVPLEEMDAETRRRAKAINFGIIYGISNFGLSKQIDVTTSEAKAFINSYFETFPGIRTFMEETKEFCRTNGYVETLFGRRIHLPDINANNGMLRAHAERQAINAPLQGTAADIIKRAMIALMPKIQQSNLDIRMLLQVHDELVFEVKNEHIEQASDLIRNTMENACSPARELSIPLVADIGTGRTWTEAH